MSVFGRTRQHMIARMTRLTEAGPDRAREASRGAITPGSAGVVQTQFPGIVPITVEGIRFRPIEADPRNGRWIWVSDDP